MSWDVIMFRIRGGLRSIEQIQESDFLPLGDAKAVRTAVSRVLPEVDWSGRPYGRYYGDGFSIEVGVDDKDAIDSMMLHVFGGGGAVTMIARLASANGWAAFDCSAGEFIDPANPSDASWVRFQQVRDFVREQIEREHSGGSEPPVGSSRNTTARPSFSVTRLGAGPAMNVFRDMRRIPFILAESALLAATSAVLLLGWRSHSVEDRVFFRRTGGYDYRAVVSASGSLHLEWLSHTPPIEPAAGLKWEATPLPYPNSDTQFYAFGPPMRGVLGRVGFHHWSFDSPASPFDVGADRNASAATGSMRYDVWSVPHWLIAVLPLPPFAMLAVRRLRRRRRLGQGLCAYCGYDLRATPDRCPECGRPATGPGTPAAS